MKFYFNDFVYISSIIKFTNSKCLILTILTGKCFTEPDDYIIKNLNDTEYYQELLTRKGEDAVKLRHSFLKIETEY